MVEVDQIGSKPDAKEEIEKRKSENCQCASLHISGTRKTKPSAVEEITILISWTISLTVIH